jgi:NADP-dependent aldehyde dehydrogenase
MKSGSKMSNKVEGYSLLGSNLGTEGGVTFTAFDPRTGKPCDPSFHTASPEETETAVRLADNAKRSYGAISNSDRAAFLNAIADNLESIRAEIVKRASLESGLPEARFEGELGRTVGQIRMFADVVLEGSWVDARIDHAIPDRQPLPKPDIRSMLRPVGAVAVFCASNFPLAFSVAGGDTVSALAAGCPVVVIAHKAHPGAAELAGKAIAKAVADMGLAEGVFSLIFSNDYAAGQLLVKHESIQAVGFTMDIAAARPEPIPVFAEMSSVNPVFVFQEALAARGTSIAEGLFGSFTLGFGQFCTKPGIVVIPTGADSSSFIERLKTLTNESDSSPLLTEGICRNYFEMNSDRESIATGADSDSTADFSVPTTLTLISADEFLNNRKYSDEVFGPTTLLVEAESKEEYQQIAKSLEGQLTATVHATSEELVSQHEIVDILAEKAGRVVLNSFPTGVEVSGAMVHGGPYPATSNAATTSVGKRAISRFARLIAYQGFPDNALPDALKDNNPLEINRLEE